MPPIGLALGEVDFSNVFLNLSRTPYGSLAQAKAAGAPTINYDVFLNDLMGFGIVAMATFLLTAPRPCSRPSGKSLTRQEVRTITSVIKRTRDTRGRRYLRRGRGAGRR